MGIDNEPRLTNCIEEADLSIPDSINKAEMVKIIKDFQVSLTVNPEQNFN